MPMSDHRPVRPSWPVLWTAVLALLLLAATWRFHLPLMLWDHLDLVPLYRAWHDGTLDLADLFRVHDGSHLHASAYAVLLLTTELSGGRPLLDSLVAWALLAAQAALLIALALRAPGGLRGRAGWSLGFALLILHPGHLVNLQWGWQVAVFIGTLFGVVIPLWLLAVARLGAARTLLALLSAMVGVAAFSTTLAMFPVAIVLLTLRRDAGVRERLWHAAAWAVALGALASWLAAERNGGQLAPPATLLAYTLNYLGGGVLRFAEDVAPAWAALALLVGAVTAARAWRDAAALPWIGLMLFAIGAALLTALGRAGEFGAGHAFVTRYVSFSSLFWLGWLGLLWVAFRERRAWRRGMAALAALTVVLAAANGVHLVKKARTVEARAQQYARQLARCYPQCDPALYEAAYGDRARVAPERLRTLRELGFPPFESAR